MEKIKDIKKRLEETVCEQLNHGIENVDCKEISETIDMIKDLAMAMYYCQITDAMENSGAKYGEDYDEKGAYSYYTPMHMKRRYYEPNMDMGTDMYYTPNTHPTPNWNDSERRGQYNSGRMYYTDAESMGKAGKVRMKYMQEKDSADASMKMKDLEDYAKVLSDDIMEMLQSANENEKAIIRNKMQVLSSRI